MTMEKLTEIIKLIIDNAYVVRFTIVKYLNFDEHKLQKMFSKFHWSAQ